MGINLPPGLVPPGVKAAVAGVQETLEQRLAALSAEAAAAALPIAETAAATVAANLVVTTGMIACSLPNSWFGPPGNSGNIVGQDAEDAAIQAATDQYKQQLATRSIAISDAVGTSIVAGTIPLVSAPPSVSPMTAASTPTKNQVAVAPQQLHTSPNPFVQPSPSTINLPTRRLAPPSTTTATAPNPTPTKVQVVQQGSAGRTYGQLIHSPVGDFTHIDYQFDYTQYNTDFAAAQKTSAANFSKWVKGNKKDLSLLDSGLIFVDIPTGTAINTTIGTQQARGTTTLPVWGTGISDIMGQYQSRSVAANRIPTHGLIPANVAAAKIPLSINNGITTGAIALGGAAVVGGAIANRKAIATAVSKIKPANLLSNMPENFEKIKDALLNSWVLEFLTFCAAMHNASMLSTNVIQSCALIVDNILAIFGFSDLVKDENGNKIDVLKRLGISFEEMLKYAIGKNNYAQAQKEWKLYSAVYTAGANMLNTLGMMQQATMSLIEVTGSYVGEIGNALKAYGVIGDSFGWMSEAITARSARYDHLNQALEEAQQYSGDIANVTGTVLSAKQAKDELGKQYGEFQTALKKAEDGQAQIAADRDKASTPPKIEATDER